MKYNLEEIIPKIEKLNIQFARYKLLENLENYGVFWNNKLNKFESESIRETQFKLSLITNQNGLKYKQKVLKYFAKPNEIKIDEVEPYLILLDSNRNNIEHKIWSYAQNFWSVPLSSGYGRRMRYLIFDRQNDKLIGIFGLTDPIIGFNVRDSYIGWNKEQKHERLYNCMTAYILGAVPPYNKILGSKLIALSTMFNEVRRDFKCKYEGKKTLISGKVKTPELVMIDTFGAFMKSAIYTRLLNWEFIDYTQGKSHIHITANGSWELIRKFVPDDYFKKYQFGQGSNWKMRTLKEGLNNLGFNKNDLTSIGWIRAYYLSPLIKNLHEFLTMKDSDPKFIDYTETELINYWKQRWVIPRIKKLEKQLNSC